MVEEGLGRATEGTWVGGGGFREGHRETEGTWVGGGGFREGYRRNMGWWRIYLLICHYQDL